MSNIVVAQATKLAEALGVAGDGVALIETLKATAFKGPVSDAQMAALLIVANQYGLSPWTKEIYAFPDKNNGIVPVVGVDGWSRIINSHPQFDGMDFRQDDESCTCVIYRKDRSHPITVTEYMDECKRGTGPWQSHPKRMLRHKAMIQCSRLAFGFAGIFDPDEAERIVEAPTEKHMGNIEVVTPFVLSEWLKLVDDSTDAETLQEVWKSGLRVVKDAKDMQGYETLKNAVQARLEALKSMPAPTDDPFVAALDAAEAT